MKHTLAPGYVPATPRYIRSRLDKEKLKRNYSTDLVTDICNLQAGGKLSELDRQELNEVVKDHIKRNTVRNKDGDISMPNGKFGPYHDAFAAWSAKAERSFYNIQDFLTTVNMNEVPGNSPLARAINLLKMVQSSQQQSPQNKGKGEGEGEGNEDGSQGSGDPNGEADSDVEGIEPGTGGSLNGAMQLSNDQFDVHEILSDKQLQTILKVSQKLNTFRKLRTGKGVKFIVDPNGAEIRTRDMNSVMEVNKISQNNWGLYQKARPIFMQKLTNLEFQVRERVEREERKQLLYLLVDGSGSMSGIKWDVACGIVLNRLQAVMREEAHCYLAFYCEKKYKTYKAFTPDEAKNLFDDFRAKGLPNGGTNTGAAIRAACKEIHELEGKMHKPEILVITDEDGSSGNLKPNDYHGITIHGMALYAPNEGLRYLAQQTGGLYVPQFTSPDHPMNIEED